jgi:hypothetical protein
VRPSFVLSLLLLACGSDPESDAVDLRIDLPPPPDVGEQFVTPALTIPPFTEQQWCSFLRYDGDDVGVSGADTFQSENGHHAILMISNADEGEYPDGSLFDCTDRDTLPMTNMEPLFIVKAQGPGRSGMQFPGGMAVKLRSGTRLVLQSHYINTSAEPILVHDAVNLSYVPVESVTTWAAPYAHTLSEMPLPPHEETTLTVDCTWEADANILFLLGHMHEHGTAFAVDWTHADTTERVYEIPEWDPGMRDQPPTDDYEAGAFAVRAGDRFVTTCTWLNTTERELNFPQEMCVTAGMAYPSLVPLICDPS